MSKPLSRTYPLTVPLSLGIAYVLYLYLSDRFVYTAETCHIFRRAQELAYDGTFPLAGNTVIGNFRLGPLADLLTAVPIWITGRMESVYFFLTLVYLISIPIFYFAVKGWLNSDVRSLAATTWFSFFPSNIGHLVSPWNTSYLNVFLAIYTLLLLRYPKGRRLLVLYGAIGLCIQCHFACITLVPASMILLQTRRTDLRQDLGWHLGGILLIMLMHLPLMVHYLSSSPEIFSRSESPYGALKVGWGYFIPALTAVPLIAEYPVVILLILLLTCSSATRMRMNPPRGKGKIVLISLLMILMVAAIQAKSSTIGFRYYYPLLPFVSLYTGYLAESFIVHAKTAAKLTGTLIIVVIAGSVLWLDSLASSLDYVSQKLHYQQWLSDEVYSWIRQHDWGGSTHIRHLRFGKGGQGIPAYPIENYSDDDCIDTMIRFRHRGEFRTHQVGNRLVVISVVQPRVPFGNPKSWVQAGSGTTPTSCEGLGDYGDIENLICPERSSVY